MSTERTVTRRFDGSQDDACGNRKIHSSDGSGTYVISENGVWIPGIFADRETAIAAFDFADGVLHRIQQAINAREPDYARRVITMADLTAAKDSA